MRSLTRTNRHGTREKSQHPATNMKRQNRRNSHGRTRPLAIATRRMRRKFHDLVVARSRIARKEKRWSRYRDSRLQPASFSQKTLVFANPFPCSPYEQATCLEL